MKKLFGKFLTFALVLVLGLSTISTVGCGDGGNQFKGLVVGGVTTTYRVGDAVDFSGVTVKVEYTDADEDKTLSSGEYTIEYSDGKTASTLTAQEGTYTITIVYLDPLFDNAKREKAIVINVVPEDVEYIEGEILIPTSFTLPDTYGVYQANVANATNTRSDAETDSSFEGKFMDVEDKNYYVGTDNGFNFLPKLRVNDAYRKFTANVEISVEVDSQPVALVASEVDRNKQVTYTLDNEVVATVDVYNHVYKFEDALDGKKVTVSVEPSSTIYDWDEGALSASFVIVKDAYNVHNATEFSVLDNDATNHCWGDGTTVTWANWKTEKGMAGIETDGVILHANIELTKNDLPAEFFWTNTTAYEYTDVDGNKMYADTYSYDKADYYYRAIGEGETFNFFGNYFSVNMQQIPVVASNYVLEGDDVKEYGDDFSNSAFCKFDGYNKNSTVVVKNAIFNGNANVSSYKDAGGDPYYAGGVIMFKYNSITANVENTIVKTSFISYFPDGSGAVSNFKYAKAYDSNQSAIFTHSTNEINIENSYFERAGGPLIMLRDSNPTEKGGYSTLYVKDSYLVSDVCGQELFFTSKNATSIVAQVAQLSSALSAYEMGSYAKTKNDVTYINAIVVILSSKNDLESVLKTPTVEGRVVIDKGTKTFTVSKLDCGYSTVQDLLLGAQTNSFVPTNLPNNVMATVSQIMSANDYANGIIAPIFACEDNYGLVTYYDGTQLQFPVSAEYGGGQTNVINSFANSDYVGLYYGGATFVLGLNH